MLRARWTGIATALAIAVAAAVTAGCGGGSSTALSLDPVAAAAAKAQHAGAARIRFALDVSGAKLPAGKTLHVHGAGAIDGTSSKLTIEPGSLLRQTGVPAQSSIEEISLEQNGDYVVYVQAGFLASHLAGGKQWIKLDLSKLGRSAGLDLGTLLSGSGLQPGNVLSMLEAGGARIDDLGSTTIDGAAATHYRVTVDVAKALQARGLTNPLLAGLVAQLPKIPADVWIGKDGLLHRIQISLDLPLPQSAKPVHLGLTIDVYDYGADVTIAAPPGSDVYDATKLAGQGLFK